RDDRNEPLRGASVLDDEAVGATEDGVRDRPLEGASLVIGDVVTEEDANGLRAGSTERLHEERVVRREEDRPPRHEDDVDLFAGKGASGTAERGRREPVEKRPDVEIAREAALGTVIGAGKEERRVHPPKRDDDRRSADAPQRAGEAD